MTEFDFGPDPDNPGWSRWDLRGEERFNHSLGKLIARREGELVRVRGFPAHRHSNLKNDLHGGALAAYVDAVLFAAAHVHGVERAGGAATVDLSIQFAGAGEIGEPLDFEVELVRETGRLAFLRGVARQGARPIASFMGTIRKPSSPR